MHQLGCETSHFNRADYRTKSKTFSQKEAQNKPRRPTARGTSSSDRSHVSPPALSACAYAHCATRFEAASSDTMPLSSMAAPIWSP
jgi:hypothetical protein